MKLLLILTATVTACGGSTHTIRHEGNSRHDVVISLNLFGECNAIEDEKLQKKCFKSVTELLAVLAERDNQEDGDDD